KAPSTRAGDAAAARCAARRPPSGRASLRRRRMAQQVAPQPPEDRVGDAGLVARVAEPLLLVRVADEGGLDQDRRNVRRLQHREAGLLDARLVQLADAAEFAEHEVPEAARALDLRGRRQVEQYPLDFPVAAAQIHA